MSATTPCGYGCESLGPAPKCPIHGHTHSFDWRCTICGAEPDSELGLSKPPDSGPVPPNDKWGRDFDWTVPQRFVDSREFYELMQAYRHCPLAPLSGVVEAFEAVKNYVRRAMPYDDEVI